MAPSFNSRCPSIQRLQRDCARRRRRGLRSIRVLRFVVESITTDFIAPSAGRLGCVSLRRATAPGRVLRPTAAKSLRKTGRIGRVGHGGRNRSSYDHAVGVAIHPLPDPLLFRRLSRPSERRLRQADDGLRPQALRDRVWFRRGRVLPFVFSVRSALERHPGQSRRANMDRAHPVLLGRGLRGDGLHPSDRSSDGSERRVRVLLPSLSARFGRGGVLSGHYLFPDAVVSRRLPGAQCRLFHGDDPAVGRRRFASLGRTARPRWRRRLARLAMAVHRRSNAVNSSRVRRLLLFDRSPGGCALAS